MGKSGVKETGGLGGCRFICIYHHQSSHVHMMRASIGLRFEEGVYYISHYDSGEVYCQRTGASLRYRMRAPPATSRPQQRAVHSRHRGTQNDLHDFTSAYLCQVLQASGPKTRGSPVVFPAHAPILGDASSRSWTVTPHSSNRRSPAHGCRRMVAASALKSPSRAGGISEV